MLDEIDRRAEQEGIATSTLRKYQIRTGRSKTMLYNNIARAGEMPAAIIKRRKIAKPKMEKREKKQIPIFSLEE